jgi:hypothetical protein
MLGWSRETEVLRHQPVEILLHSNTGSAGAPELRQ